MRLLSGTLLIAQLGDHCPALHAGIPLSEYKLWCAGVYFSVFHLTHRRLKADMLHKVVELFFSLYDLKRDPTTLQMGL